MNITETPKIDLRKGQRIMKVVKVFMSHHSVPQVARALYGVKSSLTCDYGISQPSQFRILS